MPRTKSIRPNPSEPIAPPIDPAMVYVGRSQYAIDGSSRVMLPPAWRQTGAPMHFFVIIADSKDHLIVSPPAVFKKLLERIRTNTADRSLIPHMERELSESLQEASLDRFGRLPLPMEFLAQAGMEKQGELVGLFEKFEIWHPDKYQAAQAQRKPAAAALWNEVEPK